MAQPRVGGPRDGAQELDGLFVAAFGLQLLDGLQVRFELLGLLVNCRRQIRPASPQKRSPAGLLCRNARKAPKAARRSWQELPRRRVWRLTAAALQEVAASGLSCWPVLCIGT